VDGSPGDREGGSECVRLEGLFGQGGREGVRSEGVGTFAGREGGSFETASM
jgi:hypothetical protein